MGSLPARGLRPERIAVVRLSAIGDTVHAVPVIASLRRAWPDSHLAWVIQPGPLELMAGRPDVDEFITFERARGLRGLVDFHRSVRGRTFDLVLNLHPNFKGGVATALLSASRKVGYDRARSRDGSWLVTDRRLPPRPLGHIQEEYFEFLEHLGVPVRREWDFHFSAAELEARAAWPGEEGRPVLGAVIRSSDPDKDWILDRWARVLDVAATEFGYRTVLLGGASRGETVDAARLREACRVPPENELRYDLRRLAWLLDACDLVVAPDTGPLHLAAALGTPVIGLYGTTDPKRFGPYRFRDLVIDRYTRPGETRPRREKRRGNMERILEEDVIRNIEIARRRGRRRAGS